MGFSLKSALVGAVAVALSAGLAQAQQRELVINTDTSDPAPKAAFEQLIKDFEAANPDVTVTWNLFDHEGYKTAIRNFLSADAPDLANWYAGNRMAPFVNAGQFEDVSDVWDEHGLHDSLKSAAASMTIDGKQWGVPYTYYQWGIYYRKDIFADLGIDVPSNWDELLAASATLDENGITPFAIGTKALWPTGGWFDYMNLRVNGYDFHMDLTAGEVAYTDDRVREVFTTWAELIEPGYFVDNHAALDWQDAIPLFVQGEAAMYLMGNFAVALMLDGGLTADQVGFMQFPRIKDGIPMAEDAPTDTIHIPANARNKEDAKKFLAFLASADAQTKINDILGQLPVNNGSQTPDDAILQQGFEMLSDAYALAQFYDRDAPAQMAKAGMEGFQEFMVRPGNLDRILDRLEKVRARVYR